MVMMVWINAAIHHNGIYVHSNPQHHSYSCGRERGSMDVCKYLFSFCIGLWLNPRSSTGIALPLICCSFFSTSPFHLLLYVLLFFLFAPYTIQAPMKVWSNILCVLRECLMCIGINTYQLVHSWGMYLCMPFQNVHYIMYQWYFKKSPWFGACQALL